MKLQTRCPGQLFSLFSLNSTKQIGIVGVLLPVILHAFIAHDCCVYWPYYDVPMVIQIFVQGIYRLGKDTIDVSADRYSKGIINVVSIEYSYKFIRSEYHFLHNHPLFESLWLLQYNNISKTLHKYYSGYTIFKLLLKRPLKLNNKNKLLSCFEKSGQQRK